MNTSPDLEIIVSGGGLPFDESAVMGVSISYGVNSIPVAYLDLDPVYIQQNNPDFLCNNLSYRKRTNTVHIEVKTKFGCLKFDGFFDGLTVNQNVGNYQYTAIIKSRFQRFKEIYPKLIGFTPDSNIPYTVKDPISIFNGRPDLIFNQIIIDGRAATVGADNVVKWVKAFLSFLCEQQLLSSLRTNSQAELTPIEEILVSKAYQDNIEVVKDLVDQIDITASQGCIIQANPCVSELMKLLVFDTPDTLWDCLLSAANWLGCCLVPGNDKLYLIPQSAFLKVDYEAPQLGIQSNIMNLANPADYISLSVNDNDYSNVGSCYVVAEDSHCSPIISLRTPETGFGLGKYPNGDTDSSLVNDGSAGILVIAITPMLFQAVNYAFTFNDELQRHLSDKSEAHGAGEVITSTDQVETDHKTYDDAVTKVMQQTSQQIFDNYAKTRFLQAKFGDRIGSLTMPFNPYWMPGTGGAVYTRLPGLFYAFFVNSVFHTVSKQSQSVTTQVSFNSVRSGAKPSNIPGIDTDTVYQYNFNTMQTIQNDWSNNVSV